MRNATGQIHSQQAALERQATELERQAGEMRVSDVSDAGIHADRLEGQASRLRRQVKDYWKADWRLLLLAGVVYAISLVPAAFFWHRCLQWTGAAVPWSSTLRAYCESALGKYVPGKAMVVVIRISALSRLGVGKMVTTATTVMETLTMMAVGGALAAACVLILTPWMGLDWRLALLSAGVAVAMSLPSSPPAIRFLIGRMRRRHLPSDLDAESRQNDGFNVLRSWNLSRMFRGWVILSLTWVGFGVSLGLVLQSLAITDLTVVSPMQFWISALAACMMAVVLGFLSMLPAGAGAREVAITLILGPVVGPAAALASAVWLRIIWLATELIVASIWQFIPRHAVKSRLP